MCNKYLLIAQFIHIGFSLTNLILLVLEWEHLVQRLKVAIIFQIVVVYQILCCIYVEHSNSKIKRLIAIMYSIYTGIMLGMLINGMTFDDYLLVNIILLVIGYGVPIILVVIYLVVDKLNNRNFDVQYSINESFVRTRTGTDTGTDNSLP